ncbi:transcription factor E2F6 isoform X2 [Oryzias melastigma]|uniref:transcription factor E2F6 isoform X2 n=1 Tax=Oryzias melastigma TaxID=30732 RepID=UPI000CF7C7B8|nr:transcription factor E2F6 isoform X2 [Oryzias melastigma]
MVKCVVSGCPNRMVAGSRGAFNRTRKRFFHFPKDPARVKVWLAALRETEKQDSSEQHLICEDHFLPEDISNNGVSKEAIPIMPHCLDGPLISPWGAESSEDDDPWAAGGDDCEGEGGDGDVIPFKSKISIPEALPAADQHESGGKVTSEAKTARMQQNASQTKMSSREDVSLGLLAQRFLDLLQNTPDGALDLRDVTISLNTRRRRVYDITNVLEGINLIERQSANKFKWIGNLPISNFLGVFKIQKEVNNLKLVENTLDSLIKSCAQQLFDLTDDLQNSALAYVTHEDISHLQVLQEQTVMAVKAPEETKLEVPAPKEDSIQVHLKADKGPIMVMTCDVGVGQQSSCFLALEESGIKVAPLKKDH